jgi:hypothetical protein
MTAKTFFEIAYKQGKIEGISTNPNIDMEQDFCKSIIKLMDSYANSKIDMIRIVIKAHTKAIPQGALLKFTRSLKTKI